jgi:phytoene dehydrogenase-like protein
MEYDVIVIGGGLSGLMAGFTAAKRGKKVLLLEKHATVGGLGAGFWRKGYYFDAGMSRCLSYIRGPLKAAGIKLELQPQRLILNIAGAWANYSNLEQFFADLQEIFPEEQSGLQRLYGEEIQPAMATLAAFFADMDPEDKSPKILHPLRMLNAVRSMRKNKRLFEAESQVLGRYLNKESRAYAFLAERED